MRQLHAGVFLISLAFTGMVTAILLALAIASPDPVAADGVVYLLGFLTMALAGCVLAGFRPRHAIAWVFVAGASGTLLASALKGIAIGEVVGVTASAWLGVASLVLYALGWIAVTTLPLLLFPGGTPEGRWARFGVVSVCVLGVVVTVAILIGAQPDEDLAPSPLTIVAWESTTKQVVDLVIVVSAVITIASAVQLGTRWRRASGLVRRQLAWLGAAGLLMAALLALSLVMVWVGPGLPDIVGATVEAIEIAVIPLAMLGAILDARLFDIDVVFRRSLVYGVLVGLVVTLYAAGIAIASSVVDQAATAVGTLVASAVIALALAPAKDWLTRQVESRLYGIRRRPAAALALVGERVGDAPPSGAGDARATLEAAASALGVGLRLGAVRIVLDGDPPLDVTWRAFDTSPVPDATVELDLVAFGVPEGSLEVTAGAGDTLTEGDVALLRQLAPQVSLVAHAVRAGVSLQRSRERIVGAREAERLRLRRDLHDGLGPALVGLALQAEAAEACLASDPVRAAELNARVATGLRDVIDGVREAVDGLRPTELDELGLSGALTERARSLSAGGIAVEVRSDVSGLSPATEVAAYRIATEAIANVVRHAEARSCQVRLERTGDLLTVSVQDDGRGLEGDATGKGVGLGSMRARAEEIGGRLTVASDPAGGTLVEAVLPLGTPAATQPTPDTAGSPLPADVTTVVVAP